MEAFETSSKITDSFTCNAYIGSFSVTTFASYVPWAHTKTLMCTDVRIDVYILRDGHIPSTFFNYDKHTILSPLAPT